MTQKLATSQKSKVEKTRNLEDSEGEGDDDLVYASSITLQLAWTQPLYVSAYEDKDQLEASMSPRLFDYDDEVLITDEEVEMIYFRGKLQR